jgi:hypothetical protein
VYTKVLFLNFGFVGFEGLLRLQPNRPPSPIYAALTQLLLYHYIDVSRVDLLDSYRAPAQVAIRGRLTRYGGYCGNKIPRMDQNQHHCLVVKGELQRLGE